ncbi:MAG: molybdopterin molybdotransferase MoeA [Saprospiraceae bacterium]
MIDVKEAIAIVLNNSLKLGTETIPLKKSIGRILAEDIVSDRPFPPFDRVCMDGISISYNAYKTGQREFEVEDIGAAGTEQRQLKDDRNCIEIMTGAPLPIGTDTVIRYEDLEKTNTGYAIKAEIKPKVNIHFTGSDHEDNDSLLKAGATIKAIDINVLATVGKSEVKVYKSPKVAVISTGHELIPIIKKPLPHQIRRSNTHMLIARLDELGIEACDFHVSDNSKDISIMIKSIVDDHDVLMFSGGVSKGKFDFIPKVLKDLHFEKLFHRVAQRPGKPFWFGKRNDKVVFAFPGNPVSTLACFHKYFIPWYNKTIKKSNTLSLKIKLEESVIFKPDLTYFAQAKLFFSEDATLLAKIDHGNGSGDMVNPTKMDGFVELPRGKVTYEAGEVYDFISFAPLNR